MDVHRNDCKNEKVQTEYESKSNNEEKDEYHSWPNLVDNSPERNLINSCDDEVNVDVSSLFDKSPGCTRRAKPACPGVYIYCTVENIGVWCTVDTGAANTIISKKLFDRFSGDVRLEESNRLPLEQAAENPLE